MKPQNIITVIDLESLHYIAQKDPNLLLEAIDNKQKFVFYQIFTRLFGNIISQNVPYGTIEENGVSKFNDINEVALQNLKQMGITHIWYTGVIEHAVLSDYQAFGIPLDDAEVVKGRAGSPYAIKDYYDVDPDLAADVPHRMRAFEALVERTHGADIKVIIDFVPNHVARRYGSDARPDGVEDFGNRDDTGKAFDPNNNFYYIPGEAFQVPADYQPPGDREFDTEDSKFEEFPAKATGNDQFTASPGINDWFETVKLNYGVDYLNDRQTHFDPMPDTWHKMLDILLFWAGKNVDGFRCDMAG
jgi:glycosidase